MLRVRLTIDFDNSAADFDMAADRRNFAAMPAVEQTASAEIAAQILWAVETASENRTSRRISRSAKVLCCISGNSFY